MNAALPYCPQHETNLCRIREVETHLDRVDTAQHAIQRDLSSISERIERIDGRDEERLDALRAMRTLIEEQARLAGELKSRNELAEVGAESVRSMQRTKASRARVGRSALTVLVAALAGVIGRASGTISCGATQIGVAPAPAVSR